MTIAIRWIAPASTLEMRIVEDDAVTGSQVFHSSVPCILMVSSARAGDEVRDWDRPLPLWPTESVGKLGRPSLVLPRARTVAWAAFASPHPARLGWCRNLKSPE